MPSRFTRMSIVTRLVARLDNIGDVVLAGPAVRAVAAAGEPVVFLAGPNGTAAASLLPGVGQVLIFDAPWVPYDANPVDPSALSRLIDDVRRARVEEAVILTSFHQSPLPLALLLRQAGVRAIAATSVDYPGSLVDTRVGYDESIHEVEQSLRVCASAGYRLPPGDDGRLHLDPVALVGEGPAWPLEPYVVVHPGASVPARALPVAPTADLIRRLTERGVRVVVSGSEAERTLCASVITDAEPGLVDLQCGGTSLAGFASLLRAADVVVCGNTGTVHLAAAVGTPIVEAFAPVVSSVRWRPWQVPHVLLGNRDIDCAGCRSRRCPVEGQPCLAPFTAEAALRAIEHLAGDAMAERRALLAVAHGEAGAG